MITITQELELIQSGLEVLEIEAASIKKLAKNLNNHFAQACQMILNCQGRIIVTGMGKSGHIARKIAATFASTGTPAFFVHPGEAIHGDLGMITANDLVIALSNSGETSEILSIIPSLKYQNTKIISLCGVKNSKLANYSDLVLNIEIDFEACPLNLAPTASTTVALALGDALAVAVLKARGFTARDFARSHPGGKLGKTLLLTVNQIMHTGNAIPQIISGTKIAAAVIEITNKRLGMGAVVNESGQVIGICTDGDLRRAITNYVNLYDTTIDEIMTVQFTAIDSKELAVDALKLMRTHHINCLLVIEQQQLIGAFNMHDLLLAGII
jgi:arabinose-5-phosphate isomerase